MNPGYILLAWRDAIGRDRARAVKHHRTGLDARAQGQDFELLAPAGTACETRSDGLVLLGRVLHPFTHRLAGKPLERLRELVASTWGSYVAFLPGGNDGWAMVDPSGAGRAHLARDRHLAMITDALDPRLMREAGFEIEPDTAALAGALLDPGTMVTAPLLRGVTAMVPGTAYPLGAGAEATSLWSPAGVVEDGEADGRYLRRAVDDAVRWVGGERPLVELSGGLDSSIILGTMNRIGIDASAVGVQLLGGDVDEIRYAQATARLNGVPLKIGRTTAYPDYATFMAAGQSAQPYMYGVDDAFAGIVRSAVDDGVERIVTGQGGDAVFFQPATPLTTVDRVRALGFGSGWHALLDDARRTRSSIWHHLLPALADRFRPTRPPEDELAGNLLTREAREGRRHFIHPWCAEAAHLPPGRRLQILMLANSLIFHSTRPIDLGRPLVHPLLSQPVLEAALAIPTWRLASGPFDRGLARRMFADRLHPDIAARRSKGEAAAFYSRAAEANLPYLRERLLGGALVKAGIADRSALERALTPEYLFHSLDYRALILHAACEAWLGAWTA